MNKNRILILFGVVCVFTAAIVVVTALSLQKQPGNFERRLLPGPAIVNALEIPGNHFYVAGFLSDTVLLGDKDKPDHLYFLMAAMTRPKLLARINSDLKPNEPAMIQIHGRGFHYTGLNSSRIFYGNTRDWKAHELVRHPAIFLTATPFSKSTYALKMLTREQSKTILALERSYDTAIVSTENILAPQMDGIFSTDGMLLFNASIDKLVYLYYYRNEFMVMDTTLKLLYRGHTIDSTSVANIKVVKTNSTKETVLDTPPNITNSRSAVDGKWLFVNSTILAKNESETIFSGNSVIDCYDLTNGNYAFSFYLPNFNDRKIRSFAVHGNTLIAIYRDHVARYSISLND